MADQQISERPQQLKERLKAGYDAIAPVYNAWTSQHSDARLKWLNLLLQLLPSAEQKPSSSLSMLELGCGAGEPVTRHLLSTLPDVHITANDISTTQIALAKASIGNGKGGATVTWREGDMMELSFADASLDAVVALYSVIHLPREEQTEMLARVAKWLRPGGVMLANFSAEEMAGVVTENWLDDKGWMYWSGWGAEGSMKMVQDAGLEVIKSELVDDPSDAKFLWVLAKRT
ncbi:methyltransferase [Mariannaea sp. PMI_226]|nr:methyltransferase [Mariannaea sp. PMI_226]